MVIHHSLQLLEHLTEIEEKIQRWEQLMDELKIDCDREQLLKLVMSFQKKEPHR